MIQGIGELMPILAQNKNNIDTKWDFWVDRGGTFTDIVARDPKGKLNAHKWICCKV
jgi:hypothetical protein